MAEELRLTLLAGAGMTLGERPVTGYVPAKVQALACYPALAGTPGAAAC